MEQCTPPGNLQPVFRVPFLQSLLHSIFLKRKAYLARSGDAGAIRSLTREYAGTRDTALQQVLLGIVAQNQDPATIQVLCDEVMKTGDCLLVSLAAGYGIAPLQPESRALYLFAAGRISDLSTPDMEQNRQLLDTAYHHAPVCVQRMVCDAAQRWNAEPMLADILLGSGDPKALRCLSGYEWETIVRGLISVSRQDALYTLLPEIPVPFAVHAIRSLQDSGWSPAGMTRELWNKAVCTLPEQWSYPDSTVPEHSVLEKPSSQTRHLLFSPDGSLLATSGYDGTIRLWDVKKGDLLSHADACRPESGFPVFSPDGRFLLTRDRDGDLAVRTVPSMALLRKIGGHFGKEGPVAISPDSTRFACADGKKILLARIHDGSCTAGIEGPDSRLTALSFSPDAMSLCGGYSSGTVRLWSLEDGRLLWTHSGRTGAIASISFSPDGTGIIAIFKTGYPVRIDAKTGSCTCIFAGAGGKTISGSCSLDRRYLVVASDNDRVDIWRTSDGCHCSSLLIRQKGGAALAAIVPDKRLVITGGRNGILRIFRYDAATPDRMFTAHADWVSALAVSPDGKILASAGWDGTTMLWGIPSGQLVRPLPVNTRTLSALAISGDSRTLAAATGDGRVWLWQISENRFVKTLDAFTGSVAAVALNKDGSVLACAGRDATVRLWNTADGSMIGALPGISGSTRALVFTPDGKRLLSGGWDGLLRCWSPSDCRLAMTCAGHTGVINSIACSPDGSGFVSGGSDGTVRIWDTLSGSPVATCAGDRRVVECATVTPDGTLVAAGGRDALIRLFRMMDGDPVAEIAGAPATLTGLAVTPGGDLLAAGSDDGSIGYYSIARRIHIRNFSAHAGRVAGIACCKEGRLLASCGSDDTIRLWNLPESVVPASQSPDIMSLVAHEAAGNPSRQARGQWEFLHAFLALCFAHEICLFFPPHSVGEYDIGIIG